MNKLWNGKVVFSLVFVVVLLILFITDLSYNYQARMVPMIVVIPSLILAVVQFSSEVRAALRGEQSTEKETLAEKERVLAALAAAEAKVKADQSASAAPVMELAAAATSAAMASPSVGIAAPVETAAVTAAAKSGADGKKGKQKLAPGEMLRRELMAFGWLAGLVAMIWLFGFNIGVPILLFAFLRFHGRESWKLSILYPLILYGAIYLVFVMVMRTILYDGIILDTLGF